MKGFRRAKRWLALLLAITLAFSNTAFTDVPAVVRADDGVSDGTEAAAPAAVEEPVKEETVVIDESADTWEGGETTSSDDTWEYEEAASPDETPEDGETTPPDGIPADGDTDSSDDIQTPEPAPEFEPIPIPIPGLLQVKFTVQGKGNVKVSISDRELPSEINGRESGFLVTKDSTVTFTAQADAGYSIGEVTVDGSIKNADSQDGDAYTYEITADINKTVNISFVEVKEGSTEESEDADVDDTDDTEDTDAEQPAEYKVTIDHILHTDNYGDLCTTKEVTLTADDFKDGSADLMNYAYDREGMVCDTKAASVSKADFTDGHAKATIYYSVAKGWKAVWASGIMTLSVFRGTIEDVVFEKGEDGKIPVQISFIFEDGTSVADKNADERFKLENPIYVEKGEGEYKFEYTFPAITGYKPEIDDGAVKPAAKYQIVPTDDGNYKISATLADDLLSDAVRVVFIGNNNVKYTIKYKVPEGADVPYGGSRVKEGKAGQYTEVGGPEDIPTVQGCTPQEVTQKVISGEGDTTVEVNYIKNIYSITYDTDGGTYIPPVKGIEFGETVALTEEKPTKDGYEFLGWYETKEGSNSDNPITKVASIDSDKTVYARWEQIEVNYTVMYWKEIWDNDSNGSYYSFIDLETGQAFEGTEITGQDPDTGEDFAAKLDYSQYYTRKDPESVKVAADGSTIVNVYYDLKRYTAVFDVNSSSTATGTFKIKGVTYGTEENPLYEINEIVIGMDLSEDWPYQANITCDDETYVFHQWDGWFVSQHGIVTESSHLAEMLEKFDKQGKPYVLGASWQKTNKIFRQRDYLQDANDTELYIAVKYPDLVDSSAQYKLFGPPLGFVDKSEKPDGDEYPEPVGTNEAEPFDEDGKQVYEYIHYYDRAEFSITYMNAHDNTEISVNDDLKSARYGQNIESYEFNPDCPSEFYDAEDFQGWYKDRECTKPFTFETMPAENLLLYAKWDLKDATVKAYNVDPETGNESFLKAYTVKKGQPATSVANPPERRDYIFDGWYTDKGYADGSEFEVEQPVKNDVTIYAKWVKKTVAQYTVRHIAVDEDGNEEDMVLPQHGTGEVGATILLKALSSGNYNGQSIKEFWLPDPYEISKPLSSDPKDNDFRFYYYAVGSHKYKTQYVYTDGKTETLLRDTNEADFESVTVRSIFVKPDQGIINDLKDKGFNYDGYGVNLDIDPTKDVNIATFYLTAVDYTISYEGIDDDTRASIEGFKDASYPDKYNAAMLYTASGQQIVLPTPKVAHYKFLGWTTDVTDVEGNTFKEPQTEVTIDYGSKGDIVFVAHFEQITHDITIEVENGTHNQDTDIVNVADGSDLSIKFDPKSDSDVKYVLDTVTVVKKENGSTTHPDLTEDGTYTFKDVTDDYTIKVVYAEDKIGPADPDDPEKPDGIPDKYQALVTYKIVNGTWDGTEGNNKPKQVVLTLKVKENGVWNDNANVDPKVPTGMQPDTGYKAEGSGWDQDPTIDNIKNNIREYTYSYGEDSFGYTVNVHYEDRTGTIATEVFASATKDEEKKPFGSKISYTEAVKDKDTYNQKNYLFEKVVINGAVVEEANYEEGLTITEIESQNVVDIYYTIDALSADPKNPKDPEEPDNIPDKYQALVTYEATNGTVEIQQAVVTLFGDDGEPAVDGTGRLKDTQIPEGKAGDGYDSKTKSWGDKEPTTDYAIKNDETFNVSWGKGQYRYTVRYVDEDGKDIVGPDTNQGPEEYGTTVTVPVADDRKKIESTTLDGEVKHYALDDEATKDLTIDNDEEKNVIEFKYSLDEKGTEDPEKPDGIPDKYQAVVTYKAINGEVSIEKAVVTLLGADGKPAVDGTGHLASGQIPTATMTEGYDSKTKIWSPEEPTTTYAIKKNETFTVTWGKDKYEYTVRYVDEDGNNITDEVTRGAVLYGEPVTETADKMIQSSLDGEEKNYALDDEATKYLTIGNEADKNVIVFKYSLDEMGNGGNPDDPEDPTDPEFPNKPDGIPDKYQVIVTYKGENGEVDFSKAVVTLLDDAGKYAEKGKGYLKDNQIPGGTPDPGYDAEKPSWKDDKVPKGYPITKAEEFTLTWAKASIPYTVKYVDEEGKNVADEKKDGKAEFESTVTEKAISIKDYVVISVSEQTLKISADEDENVIKFVYSLDKIGGGRNPEDPDDPNEDPDNPGNPDYPYGPDGIPDKYQALVTYKIENGTWDGEDSADRIVVINLYKEPEVQGGEWTKIPEPDRQIPKGMSGNRGYTVDNGWDEDPSEAEITGGKVDYVFTYSYGIGTFGYTVNYHYGDSIETTSGRARYGAVVSYDTTSPKGYNGQSYILDNVKIGGEVVTDYSRGLTITDNAGKNVADVYYTLNGAGGGDPGDPGEPEDPDTEPTPTPGPEPTPDTTPDNITPAVITAAPAPITAVPQAVVPTVDNNIIGEEDIPLAAGSDGGVTIGEEAVPLASKPEEIMCCILHLLVMCVAMLVELYYFHDRKKRQKKEREVRLELGK